jgi:hypothetical protein
VKIISGPIDLNASPITEPAKTAKILSEINVCTEPRHKPAVKIKPDLVTMPKRSKPARLQTFIPSPIGLNTGTTCQAVQTRPKSLVKLMYVRLDIIGLGFNLNPKPYKNHFYMFSFPIF